MHIQPNDIDAYLSSLEYEYDIAILGAWDNGSHAWGIAGPTSDYDITVVYTQSAAQYGTNPTTSIDTDGTSLSTVDNRTQIDPDLIELAGWDARRFIELLLDSNPAALEALHSPITYRGHPQFEQLRSHTASRFHVIDLANHYRSMAKRNYRKYITGEKQTDQTVKRTLNVVRSCMYSEYVYKTHSLPLLNYPNFLRQIPETIAADWNMDEVWSLVDEKQDGNGSRTIGDPFADTITAKLDELRPQNVDPQTHIRDEHISAETVREEMQDLIRSRLLTQ